MNHLDSHLTAASAAVASVAAAAVMSFPLDWSQHQPADALSGTLGCIWQAPSAPVSTTVFQLTNRGAQALPAGQRFHWVTLGTPAPTGASGVLPAALAPGERVAVDAGAQLHAAGCKAVALP